MSTFVNPFAGMLEGHSWRVCSVEGCGRETLGEQCGECTRASERAAEMRRAEREALRKIPDRYRWAERDHALLAERVRPIRFRDDEPMPGPDGRMARPVVPLARAIHRILSTDKPIVTILGNSRTGKTCLAAALFRASGSSLDYAEWHDAVDLASASLESELGERAPSLIRAERCKILVLDELRDPGHKTKTANLFDIINRRHQRAGVRTVVTTGLEPKDIAAAAGGSGGYERLMEPESALVVHLERKVQAA